MYNNQQNRNTQPDRGKVQYGRLENSQLKRVRGLCV